MELINAMIHIKPYFRVAPSLGFKTRVIAKLLISKKFFISSKKSHQLQGVSLSLVQQVRDLEFANGLNSFPRSPTVLALFFGNLRSV